MGTSEHLEMEVGEEQCVQVIKSLINVSPWRMCVTAQCTTGGWNATAIKQTRRSLQETKVNSWISLSSSFIKQCSWFLCCVKFCQVFLISDPVTPIISNITRFCLRLQELGDLVHLSVSSLIANCFHCFKKCTLFLDCICSPSSSIYWISFCLSTGLKSPPLLKAFSQWQYLTDYSHVTSSPSLH